MSPTIRPPYQARYFLVAATTAAMAFSISHQQTSELQMLPRKVYNPNMIESHVIRYDRLMPESGSYLNLALKGDIEQEELVDMPTTMKLHIRIKAPTPLEFAQVEDSDGNL